MPGRQCPEVAVQILTTNSLQPTHYPNDWNISTIGIKTKHSTNESKPEKFKFTGILNAKRQGTMSSAEIIIMEAILRRHTSVTVYRQSLTDEDIWFWPSKIQGANVRN
jgi:hypothetical protein